MNGDSMRRNFNPAALAITLLVGLFISACGYSDIERDANETAASLSLKSLTLNQRLYLKMHHGDAYGTFDQLIADLNLDKKFAGNAPAVSGYVFTMKVTPRSGSQPPFFSINADPLKSEGLGATGKNHYYIDSTSDDIKVNDKRPAGSNDPSINPE